MIAILNKIFSRSKNSNSLESVFEKLKRDLNIEKIFISVEGFSKDSEIRYVGGCIRKILNILKKRFYIKKIFQI